MNRRILLGLSLVAVGILPVAKADRALAYRPLVSGDGKGDGEKKNGKNRGKRRREAKGQGR